MAPKKTKKKKVPKKTQRLGADSVPFLTVLALFSSVSVYSIFSFFTSTNDYIDSLQASALTGSNQLIAVQDVPRECQTCPDQPICSPVCPESGNGASEEEPYPIFTDLMSNDPGAVAVESLLEEGIINGYDDGTFGPQNPINRAELLTILTNAVDADFSIGGPYENCFSDVTTEWFAPFVCYAKINGWVSGYPDGSYLPGNTVNKAEALKIVLETFDFEIPPSVSSVPFSDVPVTEWYAPYASVGADAGVINDSGLFDPGHLVNRLEFVEMVYNAMSHQGLI